MSPGSNHSRKGVITPEIFDVDDYSVILDDNSHPISGNSLPDKLNVRSLSTGATRSPALDSNEVYAISIYYH